MNRQWKNHLDQLIFLGPACLLLAMFLLAPIVVNFLVAFTEMAQTIHFDNFPTTRQFEKLGKLDSDALFGFELRRSFFKALALSGTFVFFTLLFFQSEFCFDPGTDNDCYARATWFFFSSCMVTPENEPFRSLWPTVALGG